MYDNEVNDIKKINKEKFDRIKDEYDKIIEMKNEDIKKMQYEYDKLKIEKNSDINKYTNEILNINKLLMNLISNYKRIFSSNLTPKINFMNYSTKVEDFDKIITSINQEITYDKFPLLYNYFLKNKQLYTNNNPFLHSNLKKTHNPIKEKNNLNISNKTDRILFKSEKPKTIDNTNMNININFNDIINIKKLIKNKEQLEQMTKEALISYCINLNNKFYDIENYLKNNIENNNNNNDIIKELKEKINKLNIKLEEQYNKNNRNEVIINTQNRRIERIEKLQRDNILVTNIKNKKQSSSILTPNKSTLYNSSGIDFNANLSETTNKNNFNKSSLKKSNSCISINKHNRPLSHVIKKFPENNVSRNYKTNKFSREYSSKSKEFLLEHEKSIINKSQGKK